MIDLRKQSNNQKQNNNAVRVREEMLAFSWL